MSSDEIWYFLQGQESKGPFSKELLKQIYEAGQLKPETLVWREGMAGWLPSKNVPEMDFLRPGESAQAAAPPASAEPAASAKGKLKLKESTAAPPAAAAPAAAKPAAAPADPAKHKLRLKETAPSAAPTVPAPGAPVSPSAMPAHHTPGAGPPLQGNDEKEDSKEGGPPPAWKRAYLWLFSSTTMTSLFLIATGALTFLYKSHFPDIFWFVWLAAVYGAFGVLFLIGVRGFEGVFRILAILFLVPSIVLFWPVLNSDVSWKLVPVSHWFFLGLGFCYFITIWIGFMAYFTPTLARFAALTGLAALVFTGVVSQGIWKPGKSGEWETFVKEGSGRRLPGRLARLLRLPGLGESGGTLRMNFDKKPSEHKIEYVALKRGDGSEWYLMIQTLDDQFMGAKMALGDAGLDPEKMCKDSFPLLFSENGLKDTSMEPMTPHWVTTDGKSFDLQTGSIHIDAFDPETKLMSATIQLQPKLPAKGPEMTGEFRGVQVRLPVGAPKPAKQVF